MIYLTFKHHKSGKEQKSVQVVRCLTIGRSALADIQIKGDKFISRLHALIVPRPDGRIELRDLSSSTGTFIEQRGERIKLIPMPGKGGAEKGRAILAEGEKFSVGNTEVRVCYEEVLGEQTLHEDWLKDKDDITEEHNLEDFED